MSTRATDLWVQEHAGSLHEPTAKRVRVAHGGQLAADTERALLMWEPRRIVPSYAVPVDDLRAELVPDVGDTPDDDCCPFLSPGMPFAMHTTPGGSWTVRTSAGDRPPLVLGGRPRVAVASGQLYVALRRTASRESMMNAAESMWMNVFEAAGSVRGLLTKAIRRPPGDHASSGPLEKHQPTDATCGVRSVHPDGWMTLAWLSSGCGQPSSQASVCAVRGTT
jgi:hypothetical protein